MVAGSNLQALSRSEKIIHERKNNPAHSFAMSIIEIPEFGFLERFLSGQIMGSFSLSANVIPLAEYRVTGELHTKLLLRSHTIV